MVWLLRGICLVALSVIATIVTWQILQSQQPSPEGNTPLAFAGRPLEGDPQATGPITTAPVTAGDQLSGGAAHPTQRPPIESVLPSPDALQPGLGAGGPYSGADDVHRELKNPLMRGLGQMIESNNELFEQAGAGDLGDGLLAADEILWNAKQQNAEAIRQANRQVRLPGQSPNVVLITVAGLGCSSASELDGRAETMPALHRIAQHGLTAPMPSFALPEEQHALATGLRRPGGNPESDAARFSRSLWQSGYATAAIGDVSFWGVGDAQAEWEAWLGFRQSNEVCAFPEYVWSNGRRIGLARNGQTKPKQPAIQLFAQEALAYLQRHRRGRPFALCVSLTVDDLRANKAAAATPTDIQRLAWGEVDDVINLIEMQINHLGLAPNTLLMIVGLSDSPRSSLVNLGGTSAQRGNLIVARGPGSFPRGVQSLSPVRQEDLLPTVLDAIFSQRRPQTIDGTSRWSEWRSAKPEPSQAARLP